MTMLTADLVFALYCRVVKNISHLKNIHGLTFESHFKLLWQDHSISVAKSSSTQKHGGT